MEEAMILTGLEGGPFLAGDTDILELDVAVREQEAQRLSQGLDVEVDHFVVGHCDRRCLKVVSRDKRAVFIIYYQGEWKLAIY